MAGRPRSWGRSPARALEGMSSRNRRAAAVRRSPALCSAKGSTGGVYFADLRSRSPKFRTLERWEGALTGEPFFQSVLFPCSIPNGNHPRSLGPLGPSRCLTSALGARRVATRPTAREISASVGSRRGGRCRHHGRRAPLALPFYWPLTRALLQGFISRPAPRPALLRPSVALRVLGAPAPKMRRPGFGSSALCVFVPRLRGQ